MHNLPSFLGVCPTRTPLAGLLGAQHRHAARDLAQRRDLSVLPYV
jgi:hypothetical protein